MGEMDEEDLGSPARTAPTREPRAAPSTKAVSGMVELVIKAGGSTKRRDVDLRSVKDMAGLQQLVASICKRFGTDMSSGGLRMQYTDARGQTLTVSRSTSIG